jgi:hypothetical protein
MLSWQLINNGLSNTQAKQVYEVLFYNGNLYAATVGGIYKSTDNGNNWQKNSNGITIGPGALYEFCESVFEHNGSLFTGAWNGIYRSTDEGENWLITNVSGQGISAKNFTVHNGILFAARESINNPAAYKSTDSGISWTGFNAPFYNSITFFSEPTKLWVGAILGVWFSTDNGLSWETRNNGLPPDPYSSSIIRINGNLITSLKFGGSGIFISPNDGLSWEDFGQGLPFLGEIEKLIVYDNKIIAATIDGLWQRDILQVPVELISFTASVSGNDINLFWTTATETNNSGFEIQRKKSEWEKIGYVDGFGTTTEPKSYSFTNYNIEEGKYLYRLKQIDYDGTYSYSSEVKVEVSSPVEFSLCQNYPNPFNPSTTISFELPYSGVVSLKVFDILGREFETLVDEYKSSGSYNVQFNSGGLASGVYFYQLHAGDFVEAKKMILLK